KLLGMAAGNVQSKAYAVKAARADYFPKVVGSVLYLHFNDDLGTVLTGGGRTVTGPRGLPLVTFPTLATNVAVLNQNTYFSNIMGAHRITALLRAREGVKSAKADEQTARAELEKGTRQLVSGVEQLYWGLLAARRIRAGALEALQGAELLAKTQ